MHLIRQLLNYISHSGEERRRTRRMQPEGNASDLCGFCERRVGIGTKQRKLEQGKSIHRNEF